MKALAPVLVLLLAVVALAACGTDATSQSPLPTVGAAPAEAGDPVGDAGAAVDVCALMPAADVAMMAGMALTVATPDVTSGPGEHMCLYSADDGSNAMSIWVNATTGVQDYAADLASVADSAQQVDGVGDKAFSSVLGLEVLQGSTLIKIAGVDDVAAASELARTLAYQL